MDVNTLMKLMLSSNSTSALSKKSGASTDQITSVLNSMMPMLLSGASEQATNQATAAKFASALDAHAGKDTMDLTSFLGGVDMADGAKIFQHLLGSNSSASIKAAAKASGSSEKEVEDIMSMVSPLLMSIMGQQKKKHGSASTGLLQAVISAGIGQATKSTKKADDGFDLGDALGLLGKILK